MKKGIVKKDKTPAKKNDYTYHFPEPYPVLLFSNPEIREEARAILTKKKEETRHA